MTTREKIAAALLLFSEADLYDAGINLFDVLGYNTSRTDRLDDNTFQGFAEMFVQDRAEFRTDKALTDEWAQVEFLFQLTESEMISEVDLFDTKEFNGTIMESYAFFAVKLKGETYTRSQLAQITREFNKLFNMPAMLVFKHGPMLTLAVINRRLHKRDNAKDVLEKVTLIKDIRFYNPHRAHLEILFDLSFEELLRKYSFSNFVALHDAWTKCLDTKELNKRFYQELANWYFWAMDKVSFPDDIEKNEDIRNATSLIRLITRIVFVWFIKEKGLVPDILFNQNSLTAILNNFNKNNKSHNYYHAILQNLFFATLNQKMDERAFAKDAGYPANRNEYGVKNLFRYENKFKLNETEVLALFADIPFLNGGLFDCLDKEDKKSKVEYVDGFSREPKKQAIVPDYLFFSKEQGADLNEIYGTKNKRYHVKGLINILDSYKFTVTENTPLEEEIALDPELLGKVFENLLASYNPETQTTARKQTGSFYTPREIVNYMVDESLLAYLQQKLEEKGYTDCEDQLRELLSYSENPNPFDDNQTNLLIQAIDNCKILDPACGSGAFPMGVLLKLVHLLQKLDPESAQWKERQKTKASKIDDPEIRQQALDKIEDAFINNELDYGRKLFLIENCIYGVDIQPIAVQIAKLRFFISLIIDQKIQPAKENLGIQSLPNLETKFVAANTLIELEKPDVQGTLRNPEIKKLENELKELRHQYFNARTRKEKLQYQSKDKKLRQEIAGLLVNDGWDNRVAQQIVDFNPYDQNKFAPFFDPEWMFGLKEGFDIVIGNPPYHQISKDKSASGEYKEYLKRRFGTSGGRLNTFIFFIHEGFELLNNTGNLMFIIPNTFLTQEYYKDTRKLIYDNYFVKQIVNFPNMQFENAIVENITILISKTGLTRETKYFIQNGSSVQLMSEYNLKEKSKAPNFNFNISENTVLENIEKTNCIKLNEICTINQAIALKGDKSLSLRSSNPNGQYYKLLDGRNINKYSIRWDGVYLEYDINRIHSCKRNDIFESQEKLLFRRVSSSLVFAYDTEQYYALNTIVVINKKKNTVNLKYLLGVLNSKLMNYYYKEKFKSSKTVFPEIQARTVGELPIYLSKDKILSYIVDYVLFVERVGNSKYISLFFQDIIDFIVYELYLLDKITTANANILCHLDNLPDIQPLLEKGQTEKALKTIEKVYREFSAPDHPVSIAMARMQEIEEVQIIEGKK